MNELNGKTALVTEASCGIGRAAALALAHAGAQVLVHYSDGQAQADSLVKDIRKAGARADKVAVDLSAKIGPHQLARQVRSIIGDRLDILVAIACVSKPATIEDTTVADFDHLFSVNVRAPYFLVQQLLPVMCTGSNIIFLCSLAARVVAGDLSAYAATKGAVDTLVKHFSEALVSRGIRVNAIAPGIDEMDMPNFTNTEEGRNVVLGMQALRRVAVLEDIAGAIAFLASSRARGVTGETLKVEGASKP